MSSNLTLFALIDFSENIEELLKKIKKKLPNKTIRVLMQHPNPSLDEKNQYNMSCLFVSLKMCLELCIILDITFVYDFSHKRNTWSISKLLTLFMNNIDEKSVSQYSVGEEKIISLKGCNVDHPLFGNINRYGWASMKKSDEYTFSMGYQ